MLLDTAYSWRDGDYTDQTTRRGSPHHLRRRHFAALNVQVQAVLRVDSRPCRHPRVKPGHRGKRVPLQDDRQADECLHERELVPHALAGPPRERDVLEICTE